MKLIKTILLSLVSGCLLTLGVQKILSAQKAPSVETLNRIFPKVAPITEVQALKLDNVCIVEMKDDYGRNTIGIFNPDNSTAPRITYDIIDGRNDVSLTASSNMYRFVDDDCDGVFEKKVFMINGSFYTYNTAKGLTEIPRESDESPEPIPLTIEMEDKLIEEGKLPPRK